jgi:hypothetical protein
MKVCMLSSVHSTDDIRIVEKEARRLSAFGYHAMPGRIPVRAIELGLAGRAATGGDYHREHDAAELKNFYCGIFSLWANA